MSSSDRPRRDAVPLLTPATVPAAPAADPYASWADRMQRARGRHSAITRNLYSWNSYKNWADRAKTNWTDDEEKK